MRNERTRFSFVAGAALLAGLTAAPAAAQDAPDTLRVAMYQNSLTLGNVYGLNYIWPHMYWWEGSYDSFVRVDDHGQVLPFAAEKWENVDAKTWRVTFRKDVTFWSGRPNDAANVVKAFDYLHTDVGKTAGIMRNMQLASYKAVDSHTVEFVTRDLDPLFIPKLAAFYVIDMAAFADLGVKDFAVKPVASGPFRIVSWTDQEQVSTAFDKSWRPAKTKNMRLLNVPEAATRLAALSAGQLDIAFNMAPDDVPRIRAAGHVAAVEGAPFAAQIGLFTVDFAKKWGGKAPFADRRVRQAVNYAVNKDAMVNQLLGGHGKPAGQPAIPGTFGYTPDVKPYPYDPTKARQLLAEAGYPRGFSTVFETSALFGAGGDVFQVVAADLARVGINIDVVLMPPGERQKLINDSTWKGDMTSVTAFFSPMQDASIPFQVFGCEIVTRPVSTCIPELTQLIRDQARELDPKKRLALLQELMKKSNEEALALFLFDGFDITGVAKRVKGYKNWNKVIHYEHMSVDG
ncbi:MAG: ABC transporter substrate-binding protein [Alphaproteobacteria bacterium]|nr:ABC transporter substrate-binding protein [Alphaproteobacteria bacterium]